MSPSYLNDIENGRQYISMKMLERLAEFFKIPPYKLLLPLNSSLENSVSAECETELRALQKEVNNIFEERLKNV